MRRLTRALLACAAGALAAAAEADPAAALTLPAGSSRLALQAQAWQGRHGELLALLRDADPARRRGAARLCAAAGVPPADLLAALVASEDPEVRRLGAVALLRAAVPAESLLRLPDARVVCDLLIAHPDAQPLRAEPVRTWLGERLADPATCRAAAEAIAARGVLADWGERLVALVKDGDAAQSDAAHRALEILAATQVNPEPYAGDRALLAQDWRDIVAADHAPVAVDETPPEVETAIAGLPQEQALLVLLTVGDPALPALERAMAGVDRQRRRQLESAARLVSRGVGPALYQRLGAAGLEPMDAADERDRLTALRVIAEAARDLKDPASLVHLATWADDRSPAIRAAAWDRLTRLSDERKNFPGQWTLGDDSDQDSKAGKAGKPSKAQKGPLFPAAAVAGRLRRSLRQGAPDEQVSALQFLATIAAKTLADDVQALLLSPEPMVVDAALEAIGHLDIEAQAAPALARLALDKRETTWRRTRALELLAGAGSAATALQPTLLALAKDPDPTIQRAALRAEVATAGDDDAKRARLTALIGAGHEALALAAAKQDSDLEPVLWPLIVHRDPAIAAEACDLLLPDTSYDRRQAPTKAQAAELERLAASADARPDVIALAVAWNRAPREAAVRAMRGTGGASAKRLWRAVIGSAAPTAASFAEAAGAAASAEPQALGAPELARLIELAVQVASLEPGRLQRLATVQMTDLIDTEDTDFDFDDGQQTRTLTLAGGRRVVLKTSDAGVTTVASTPPDAPTAADVAAMAGTLSAITLPAELEPYRQLALAYATGATPSPEADRAFPAHDELWRTMAKLQPDLRPRLVALSGAQPLDGWRLQSLLEAGNPDLVAPVVAMLAVPETEDHHRRELLEYLATLDRATLLPLLTRLVEAQATEAPAHLAPVLARAAPLPLPAALALARTNRLGSVAIEPIAPEAMASLREALATLTPEQVVAGAPALRRLRAAGAVPFDEAMAPLARNGAAAAAWLRTGIPHDAGMGDAYEEALASGGGERWVAGAAWALKQQRLDASAFMAGVLRLDAAVRGEAGKVAVKYLAGKLGGEDAALVELLRAADGTTIRAWLPACPPSAAISGILVERVREPALVQPIGRALSSRLSADRAAWQPIAAAVAGAAGGALDHLLPKK